MNIPNFQNTQFVERSGYLTANWQLILEQLFLNLVNNVGPYGYVISPISSDPNSVTPPTSGGQLLVLQNTFGNPNGVEAGTVIFDPYEQNGAILPARNGQLKVLLNDGTFHSITNT